MSLKRVLRLLEEFGLTKTEAEVYIYLTKKGPKRETDLINFFKMNKEHLSSSLSGLQNKGIVTATIEKYAMFSAVEFERILELLVKTNIEQAHTLSKTKYDILANWRDVTEQDST
jgi:sugar-specific transcriptional regulator TrmB